MLKAKPYEPVGHQILLPIIKRRLSVACIVGGVKASVEYSAFEHALPEGGGLELGVDVGLWLGVAAGVLEGGEFTGDGVAWPDAGDRLGVGRGVVAELGNVSCVLFGAGAQF